MSKEKEAIITNNLHHLKLLLYLKIGNENGIKEAIKNDVNTYNFEGECTILQGLIEIKRIQKNIDEAVEFMIELKNKEIEIEDMDEELEEIEELDEDELDIDSEVDVTDELGT